MNAVPNPSGEKIKIVQVLRGFGAFFVMVYHLKATIRPGEPLKDVIDYIFNTGPAGVDLFFIISGFIMVLITGRGVRAGRTSPGHFFIKRLLRVWPAYIIASVCYYFVNNRFHFVAEQFDDLLTSLFFLPLSEAYPPYLGYAYLSVGWSLNYELYFYVMVAVCLLFGRYTWHVFFLAIGVTLVALPLAAGGFGADAFRSADFDADYLKLITNPIIWNFVYGVLIGLCYQHSGIRSFLSGLSAHSATVLLVVLLVVWQNLSGFYAGHGPFQWGMGMAVLFTAVLFYYEKNRQNYPEFLVYMGDISYSLYLWHLPVLAALKVFFLRVLGFPVFAEGISLFILATGLSVWVAHYSYQLVEKRLGLWINHLLVKPGRVSVSGQ